MLCVFLPLSGESWLTHTPHLPCWGASTAAPPFPFLQMEACLFPFYVEFQQTHNLPFILKYGRFLLQVAGWFICLVIRGGHRRRSCRVASFYFIYFQ